MWWILAVVAVALVACSGLESGPQHDVQRKLVSPTPDFVRNIPIPYTMLPLPTLCMPNPEWNDTYVVQPGDTLGAIAIAAGVTIKEMQEGNCLTDRDMLFVGQTLQVPNAFSLNIANSAVGEAGVVIFVRQDENGQRHLWTVRSDGAALRQVTREQHVVGQPSRSPDLSQVAFLSTPPFSDIPTAEADVPTDIWTVGADGNGLRPIADQGPNDPIYRSSPVWSPDSSRLAFVEQQGFVGSLLIIAPDGTQRTVVISGDFVPPDGRLPVAPAWSPDGTQLAVVMWDETDHASLWLVKAEARSTDWTELAEGFDYWDGPYWVPLEGDMGPPALAYASRGEQRVEWWVVDVDSGTSYRRPGGLALTHPLLGWRIQIQRTGLRLYGPTGVQNVLLPSEMTAVSWGEMGVQLIVGQGPGGLLLLDLENDSERSVTRGYDISPAWTPPRWLVLP